MWWLGNGLKRGDRHQFKIQNDQFKMKENHRHFHEDGNPAIAVGKVGAIAINSKFKMLNSKWKKGTGAILA